MSFHYLNSKTTFSLRFKAILNKIVKSMIERNENNKLIEKIKELQIRDSTTYYYDDEKFNKDNECQFIIDQKNIYKLKIIYFVK